MSGWRHAFSLSSDAVKAATPPGTVALIEHSAVYENGRYVDRVVRFPLPTASPADPLNWARWRKVACMVTVAFYAFVSNYISASMAPALPVWNREFRRDRRPLSDLMELVAFNVLVLGLGNILWVPLANVLGRRFVLVVSTVVLAAATTCGMFFTGFTATLIIRIFQGLGSSASETVTPAVVGDLFFVHERGSWMAFYTASLASGSVVGGITGGYIANNLGWIKQFWVGAGLTGLASIATFFLVPETMFDRPKHALPLQRDSRPSPGPSSQYASMMMMSPAAGQGQAQAQRASVAPRISLITLPSIRFTLPSRYTWAMAIAGARRASGVVQSGTSGGTTGSQRDAGLWPPVPTVLPPATGPSASILTPTPANQPGMTWYDTESSIELSDETRRRGQPKRGERRRGGRGSGAFGQGAGEGSSQGAASDEGNAAEQQQGAPFTFARSLKFSRYRGNLLYQFKKPWTTLALPATWIIMMQYGGLVGGVAVISTVGPQILSGKPYRWGEHAGLLFVGALVGIVFGGLCTGLLADRRLKKLARDQDHGYAEPEARIAVMVPSLLIGTCGLLVFGFCAQYPGQYQWIGLEFAYGMVAFALTQVPSIWFGYLIDSYDQLASDCFVMICILRGLIPFAWTFFVAQWVEKDGFLIPFGGFTAIMGVFSLLTIPVIFWGKRMRIATARYVTGNQ